ncbi:MAG: hypothetical protein IH604_12125 [Burkholderiales bacterium]|nr:hypothetical protein [Burkholderiales bacterium]
MRQHQRYRVCGMQISSSIPFPELRALPKDKEANCPDMEFEIGGDISLHDSGQVVMITEEPDGTPWMTCTRTPHGYRLRFTNIADFLVDPSGRRVSCVAPPGTPPETIRHLFLDQVIPPLLNLRGAEALHASAIASAHGACAFIGMSGQGKSTLASAFHVIGHPILCDDCLVLKDDPDSILVQPAYPGLRLWDDSRGEFFGNRRSTLPVSHYNDKRRISTHASDSANSDCLPLRRIYSLFRREAGGSAVQPKIEPLSIRDALVELISYTFRLDLTDQTMILRQMRVLERVAREVPVRRLHLPDDLGLLPEVRALILQDLGQD